MSLMGMGFGRIVGGCTLGLAHPMTALLKESFEGVVRDLEKASKKCVEP